MQRHSRGREDSEVTVTAKIAEQLFLMEPKMKRVQKILSTAGSVNDYWSNTAGPVCTLMDAVRER